MTDGRCAYATPEPALGRQARTRARARTVVAKPERGAARFEVDPPRTGSGVNVGAVQNRMPDRESF